MDKYIGKKLDGRYEILELIGVGGMANVYKAFDILDKKTVAVKILRDEFLSNTEFLRRFKNESKAIAVLSHPNIVKVYDVCFNDKYQSIVMEYINGITLKEYISQQGHIRWKEAVHFVVQILRALQHAHDKGIVHRDIKPQNIMLLSDGTIKVMDFGIARFAQSDTRTMTMTDKAIGSVHYISPEQARGEETDPKADIYSVGVLLFEMLTGKLPFEADSPVTVALKQIQAEPIGPRNINSSIPEGLEQITLKAMKKDASQRYESAAQMLADIDEFKRNPSIHFEYKYFVDNNPTRHMEKIKSVPSKQEYAEEPKRKSPAISILTGIAVGFVLVALLFVIGMIWIVKPFQKVDEIILDDLRGLKYTDVMESSKYDNIKIFQDSTIYNSKYPEGQICDQDPKPGRPVKVGSTVKVWVSKGAKTNPMPDFTNLDLLTAQAHLRDMKVEPKVIEIFDANITAGYVVRTSPEKGTPIEEESTVTLYVSKGPDKKPVKVPELKGVHIDDARRIIEKNLLTVGNITPVDDTNYPEGTVISQTPKGRDVVDSGTAIDLQIASGKNKLNTVKPVIDLSPIKSKRPIEIVAILDGKEVDKERLDPNVVKEWPLEIQGAGNNSKLIIKVDDKIYMEFSIDFDNKMIFKEVDNSNRFS